MAIIGHLCGDREHQQYRIAHVNNITRMHLRMRASNCVGFCKSESLMPKSIADAGEPHGLEVWLALPPN